MGTNSLSMAHKSQDGIIVGNIEDKTKLKNPISRMLVSGFDSTLFSILDQIQPKSIHEVGCGEGRLTRMMYSQYKIPIKGTDLSSDIIAELNKTNTLPIRYENKAISELSDPSDHADVVVCCEVLEHVEDPLDAIRILKKLRANHYILSVPREPVWRILNVLRLKYLTDCGNTPGHINHWSRKAFVEFLQSEGFIISRKESPFPWTMVCGRFAE